MTCNWPPLGIDPSWSGIFQCCKCQNSSGLHYYCNKNWIVNGCSSWFRSMLGLAFAILNVCFPSDGAQGKGGLDYGRIAHSSQSWTALSSCLNLSLGSGGCASVVWGKIYSLIFSDPWATKFSVTHRFLSGLVTAGICNISIAASLAEFLSAYPTWVRSLIAAVNRI